MMEKLESVRIRRRDALPFIWLALKPLIKITTLSIFNPWRLTGLSTAFSNLYSRLWDFAEHSISHQGFNLPSSLGQGPVHKTNTLLSDLYGGKFASLSFGGSSGALLTLLTAVMPKLHPKRDLILFDDVCHQSTIGGLIFGRWKAVRLVREKHPSHKTVSPITFETIRDIIELHGPDKFAAIILVLPSYDGFRSPSEDLKIYKYAKSLGISVIVDGAWDAMRFHRPKAETPPLSSICDVWITSPHKRGLTPSSLGCILTDNETIAQLWDQALDLGFRSSSISFVEIMIAEHRLSTILAGDWDEHFEKADRAAIMLSQRIKDIHPNLRIVQPDEVQAETNDCSHILISTDEIPGLDARDWAQTLSNHFVLDAEKATASTLLLLCGSPGHLKRINEIISDLKEALAMTLNQNQDRHYDR